MGEQSVHNVFMKLNISQESNVTGEESELSSGRREGGRD